MRIKSALVLTAFSALAAWATCADARLVIANPPGVTGYCVDANGVRRPIGSQMEVKEPIVQDGMVVGYILHTLTCEKDGWEE